MSDICLSRIEEEDVFFDSREDGVLGDSDRILAGSGHRNWCPEESFISWGQTLSSAQERRNKFMKWMDLDLVHYWPSDCGNPDGAIEVAGIGGVVSIAAGEEGQCAPSGMVSEENLECVFMNCDDGVVSVVDELSDGAVLRSPTDEIFSSSRVVALNELQRSFSPPSSVQHVVVREEITANNSRKIASRKGGSWLSCLGVAACVVDRQGEESESTISESGCNGNAKVQRVRVRPYKKRFKEFSAIYVGQNFKAHEGAILTMKFSPDGRYLATGGEDRVVCVWGVGERARIDEGDVPINDPSCVYFRMDKNFKLAPLSRNEDEKDKLTIKKSFDSACVIIPPDTFQISEKPLHIFRGHDGNVLDISWSKNKCLLSSSTDKTVRLWNVGCNSCLKVFSHNNYVTCVQFNPVDENYFISGSIDGKVRIWEILRCQVVEWIDVKDIVTAVCYRPDGRVGVVGFLSGDCHFYDMTGNHLQLDAQISLQIKKKFPYKRITGFQFSPSDHQKLMVTAADSQIRILNGLKVTSKYRGLPNAGSPISASFTSDGRHIVSAGEDSHVYIWSHNSQGSPTSRHAKSIWSRERFLSSSVSIAIPWHGLDPGDPVSVTPEIPQSHANEKCQADLPSNRPSSSSIPTHDFFSEFLPKGSATWPEEQLPSSSTTKTALCRSHYKFLKTSFQNTPHAWGQVVVTAGCDGRIRSFRNYGLPVHV